VFPVEDAEFCIGLLFGGALTLILLFSCVFACALDYVEELLLLLEPAFL
jgi:hypothetical protein